jgi:hypothetical protein
VNLLMPPLELAGGNAIHSAMDIDAVGGKTLELKLLIEMPFVTLWLLMSLEDNWRRQNHWSWSFWCQCHHGVTDIDAIGAPDATTDVF